MSKRAFIFQAVLGMKTERRCRLRLLRTPHFASNCSFHTFFLFCWVNQTCFCLLLVCDSELKQAPAILVALWWQRRSLAVKSCLFCSSRVFLVFFPFAFTPYLVFLSIYLPVSTPRDSSSLRQKGRALSP